MQAATQAIDTIKSDPSRREHVGRLSQMIRQRLSIEAGEIESQVPIIPVHIGDDGRALARSHELRDKGFYVPAIRPPTVPAGTARLRISISAAHDQEVIESLLSELVQRQH